MENKIEIPQDTSISANSTIPQSSTAPEPVSDTIEHSTSDEYKIETPKDEEEDIPEWGKKDPTAFLQYKLGKNNKKHARELSDLRRKIDEQTQAMQRLQSLSQPSQYQPAYEQQQARPQNADAIFDPISGSYLTPSDPQYGLVLREQQKSHFEKVQYESARAAEQQRLLQEETERFLDKMEEAKTKFNDYDEVVNSVKITPTILETVKLLPNGTDLLYYLAKNPKEVNRIINLPDYLQAKEMIKHSVSFGAKKVSSAPAPSKPLESGDSIEKPKMANMSGPQLSQYMREKIKAKYRR